MSVPLVVLHARRAGTGKTSLAASLAVTCAQQGLRAGLVDLDLTDPGLHTLFGVKSPTHSLNQALAGDYPAADCALDVTNRLRVEPAGRVFLLPAGCIPAESARALPPAESAARLWEELHHWQQQARLDILWLDTPPGLSEFALFWLAASSYALFSLRLNQQDYQDTALLVELARRMELERLGLVANQVPEQALPGRIKARVEQAYAVEVLAVLPYGPHFAAQAGPAASGDPSQAYTRHLLGILQQVTRA